MGRYGSGDSKMMIYSSEDDANHENCASFNRTLCLISELSLRDKTSGKPFGETPSVPTPPISDDTDLQFWAEDELSNSESKQKLTERQKRRRTLSYRNRITVQRSRSLLIQSSSSNLDRKQSGLSLETDSKQAKNYYASESCNVETPKQTSNKTTYFKYQHPSICRETQTFNAYLTIQDQNESNLKNQSSCSLKRKSDQ